MSFIGVAAHLTGPATAQAQQKRGAQPGSGPEDGDRIETRDTPESSEPDGLVTRDDDNKMLGSSVRRLRPVRRADDGMGLSKLRGFRALAGAVRGPDR